MKPRRRSRGLARADLLQIILQERRIARQQLVERTGFAPATVSRVVTELIEAGWVHEVGAERSGLTAGRPPVLLELNPGAARVAAMHIGDRLLNVGLATLRGELVDHLSLEHDPRLSVRASFRRAAASLRKMAQKNQVPLSSIPALGVTSNGSVDPESGLLALHPRLDWRDVPIRQILVEELRIPTRVDATANGLVLAEAWLGASRGKEHVLLVLLGNVISCGLLVNGTIYQGAHNQVGQIGHLQIEAEGPRCYCGKLGCLESLASDLAIVAQARRVDERLVEGTTMDQVVDAAEGGHSGLQRILVQRGERVGRVLAALAGMCDPEHIVIAGSAARSERFQLQPIQSAMMALMFPGRRPQIPVLPSMFRSQGNLIGAAALALEAIYAPPLRGAGHLTFV